MAIKLIQASECVDDCCDVGVIPNSQTPLELVSSVRLLFEVCAEASTDAEVSQAIYYAVNRACEGQQADLTTSIFCLNEDEIGPTTGHIHDLKMGSLIGLLTKLVAIGMRRENSDRLTESYIHDMWTFGRRAGIVLQRISDLAELQNGSAIDIALGRVNFAWVVACSEQPRSTYRLLARGEGAARRELADELRSGLIAVFDVHKCQAELIQNMVGLTDEFLPEPDSQSKDELIKHLRGYIAKKS